MLENTCHYDGRPWAHMANNHGSKLTIELGYGISSSALLPLPLTIVYLFDSLQLRDHMWGPRLLIWCFGSGRHRVGPSLSSNQMVSVPYLLATQKTQTCFRDIIDNDEALNGLGC